MRRSWLAVATALFLFTPTAGADEVGGGGFDVPQGDWLWGIEGLVRTPLDLSGDIGAVFIGYEVEGQSQHRDQPMGLGGTGITRTRSGTLDIEPVGVEGGFRLAGGIGFWQCCVMIEPAFSFRLNETSGGNRTDDTPRIHDPDDPDESHLAELDLQEGWDLAFGPQITWIVPNDVPVLGGLFGGLPLVFFPYVGITHVDYEVEMQFEDFGPYLGDESPGPDTGFFDRNFEDDMFMVGFDLDLPLPGTLGDFTHALTFSFRWVESDEQHDLGPFDHDGINGGTVLPIASGPLGASCTAGTPTFTTDTSCFSFEGQDGWRIGLYYRVTWNDFEGFFKRNLFGPVN